MKAILALSDGTIFEGENFGATGETSGEVVFNTSMTGYQEVLTDPSHPQPRVINTDQAGLYGAAISGVKKEGILRRRCRNRPIQYLNNICGGAGSSSDQTTSEGQAGLS